jgi:hypothetical protein
MAGIMVDCLIASSLPQLHYNDPYKTMLDPLVHLERGRRMEILYNIAETSSIPSTISGACL